MPSLYKSNASSVGEQTVRIPDVVLSGGKAEELPTNENVQEPQHDHAKEPSQPIDNTTTLLAPESMKQDSSMQPVSAPPALSREDLLELYADELQMIIQQETEKARKQTSREVGEEQRKQIQEILQHTDATLQLMQDQQKGYFQRYAEQLKFFAIDIAEKFIHQKLKMDETLMLTLIQEALQEFHNATWLEVEVSDQLVQLVEALQKELEKHAQLGAAKVVPSNAPLDTCRITAEEETLVATISVQAENLRKAFQNPLESMG